MNIELRGPVLVGAEDEQARAWVVGGRLTFERPSAPDVDRTVIEGWVLPGLVDAHCHVGLGSDFDGVDNSLPVGLEDVSTYPALLAEMLRRGWSDADVAKLAGGNVLRVMEAAERVKAKAAR